MAEITVMVNKTQKLILGSLLLLLVDVIWVSTSELTKFLFHEAPFDKPFFCIYFKTSLFTVYLVIVGLIPPWKESTEKNNGNYSMLDSNEDDESLYRHHAPLSDPIFVPIRTSSTTSGTESDDSIPRSVRFSRLAEVREMSAYEASEALIARLSYVASLRIRRQKTHYRTAKSALLFSVMWLISNYLLQLAFKIGESNLVQLLGATGSAFCTLLLTGLFPSAFGDKITITKCLGIIIQTVGVFAILEKEIFETYLSRGTFLALLSAFFYALYLIYVKRKNDLEEKIEIPLFFGFVGLWTLLLMWPMFFILNFLKVEKFELPTQNQFAELFLNALFGTVFAEAVWLWGCFLTSSLLGTLALSLKIPLQIAFDVIFNRRTNVPPMFDVGILLICSSMFTIIVLLNNDEKDPLLRLFKVCYRKICTCNKNTVVRINEEEQQESLISNDD